MKKIYYKNILAVMIFALMSGQALAQSFHFNTDQVTLTEQMCPSVSSLTQDPVKKTWSAPGGWHTINPSFIRDVELFVGAQWVGVNVGNIICSYARNGRSDFPIHLLRNTIVPAPIGGLWSEDKGGYKDCASTNINQCSYMVMTPTKPKSVYDEIDFFKEQPVEDTP
jgi:hypothetical protein